MTHSSLSRDFCCLSISLLPRGPHQASFLHFHLSSLIGRPPESFSRGFSLRVSVLPKVPRLRHLKSRDSCCLSILYGLAVFVRRHISTFISRPPESLLKGFPLRVSALPKGSRKAFLSESAYSRKSPERLSSPIQLPPESFLTLPPEISRFLLPLDSLRHRSLRQAPYLHFHQSPARKSPERLFSPIQRTPESFPTTPPEIARFPFGTKVIKILDLSPYLPPTRPFTLSPTLPYSPKPVLHQPRHQTESDPLVHQSPCTIYPHLTLSYNNTHQSSSLPTTPPDRIRSSRSSISLHVLSSSHPVLQQHSSVQFITSYNYQVRFRDRPIRIVILQIRLGI